MVDCPVLKSISLALACGIVMDTVTQIRLDVKLRSLISFDGSVVGNCLSYQKWHDTLWNVTFFLFPRDYEIAIQSSHRLVNSLSACCILVSRGIQEMSIGSFIMLNNDFKFSSYRGVESTLKVE